jgi:hypothetical protein
MFPCPLHNNLPSDAQADVIRRSKLAQRWGMEVKWVYHQVLESMIIINPPTRDHNNFDDGIAFFDLSLPHLDAARAKFEITQKDQAKIFSDLAKSFSLTWTKAHEPRFEREKRARANCFEGRVRRLVGPYFGENVLIAARRLDVLAEHSVKS